MSKIIELKDEKTITIFCQRFDGNVVVVSATTDPTMPFDVKRFNRTLYVNALERLATTGMMEVDVEIIHVGPDRPDLRSIYEASVNVLKPRWSLTGFDIETYRATRRNIVCVETGAIYENAAQAAAENDIAASQMHQCLALKTGYLTVKGKRFVRTAMLPTVIKATRANRSAVDKLGAQRMAQYWKEHPGQKPDDRDPVAEMAQFWIDNPKGLDLPWMKPEPAAEPPAPPRSPLVEAAEPDMSDWQPE